MLLDASMLQFLLLLMHSKCKWERENKGTKECVCAYAKGERELECEAPHWLLSRKLLSALFFFEIQRE